MAFKLRAFCMFRGKLRRFLRRPPDIIAPEVSKRGCDDMSKQSGEIYRSIRLCVDSYDQGILAGRFYHPGLEEACYRFQSLTQFLVKVESMLNEANFPQSFTAKRSFAPLAGPSADGPGGEGTQRGARGTFVIRLLFRQHTSWQGTVTWLEGGGEQTFRSVLELILLLDGALGGCE